MDSKNKPLTKWVQLAKEWAKMDDARRARVANPPRGATPNVIRAIGQMLFNMGDARALHNMAKISKTFRQICQPILEQSYAKEHGFGGFYWVDVIGRLHSNDSDQPAIIKMDDLYTGGEWTVCWYRHGKLHRDNDQPALIKYVDGSTAPGDYAHHDYQWLADIVSSKWHRNLVQVQECDVPACLKLREMRWYQRGKLHRGGNPAGPAIVTIYENLKWQEWYQRGKRHCDDGPAVSYPDGIRYWYCRGKLIRRDGGQAMP